MAYVQYYDPSIHGPVCAPSPLCDKGYLTDEEKEMYMLHNLWFTGCFAEPSCSMYDNQPPSASLSCTPAAAVAQCGGAPRADDGRLVYLDRDNLSNFPTTPDAHARACVPIKSGYGFSSDVCYVGAGNPCHVPTGGALPRACVAQCCPGNKTPDPVPSAGPCTYKRPCYDARRGDTRYQCTENCSSAQACFSSVADAYSYTRSFRTPATALPPCSSASRSFY